MKRILVLFVVAFCFAVPAFSQIQVGIVLPNKWKVAFSAASAYAGPSVSAINAIATTEAVESLAIAAREEDL